MKPYIGISCGAFRDRDWCPPANFLRKNYTDAIITAGGLPLIIPVLEDIEVLRALYDRMDGILISGGGDIDPRFYNEQPQAGLGPTDPMRDEIELPLARWAIEEGKPLLGICRGSQVINVAMGGTLFEGDTGVTASKTARSNTIKKNGVESIKHFDKKKQKTKKMSPNVQSL